MKYRKTIVGLVATASVLGTAGLAQAGHRDPGYSPCRPDTDQVRLGYEDTEDRDDPRHELPTIYANGDESGQGNIGICGGSTADGSAQFIEVGNDAGGPYHDHSEPPVPVATMSTGTPVDDHGSVNVGDDYVEVDGTEGNQGSEAIHPWLDGYVSAGLTEDGGPGVCMGGDHNRSYYAQPGYSTGQDCNEGLADEESLGYLLG